MFKISTFERNSKVNKLIIVNYCFCYSLKYGEIASFYFFKRNCNRSHFRILKSNLQHQYYNLLLGKNEETEYEMVG